MTKILIVDDSATARKLIKKSIEICGLSDVQFVEAGNGRQALDLLHQEPVDVVFTDLNMPEMDGTSLLKRIKASPKLNHLPVIVISSLKNEAAEKMLLAEHALAVLEKPLKLPEVHQVLQEVMKSAMQEELP